MSNELRVDHLPGLRIPLDQIVMATNNFSGKYLIRSGLGSVYKGLLLQSGVPITIAARRLHPTYEQVLPTELLIEIIMLSNLNHENIVAFLGFCVEGIIVYKYEARGSLDTYIRDSNLTWTQRLHICVGIAHALRCIHSYEFTHRNIKTSNILLDDDWKPKLSDFGIPMEVLASTILKSFTNDFSSTDGYVDPEYLTTGSLNQKSDIYSLGVVLFEVLCGRTAKATRNEGKRFLAQLAKSCYEEGNLEDIIQPDLWKQMDPQSFSIFSEAAYYCLKEKRTQRPNIDQIVGRLEKALKVHEIKVNREFAQLRVPVQDIISATNNFAVENLVRSDRSEMLYKGELMSWFGEVISILARRLDVMYGKEVEFRREISVLYSLKHKNVVSIIGFCDENDEKIFIYKHVVHGSLDQHLSNPTLTWPQRLQICLGVARALSYIHYDVIHCDVNSSKIYIDKDWEPKIFGFELSTKYPQSWRHRLLVSRFFDNSNMTPKYDVYSFGVLLFEVLCGGKMTIRDAGVSDKFDDIIDLNLRKQMDTRSLDEFKNLAKRCLNQQLAERPTMDHIAQKLELVLELQMKHGIHQHSTTVDKGASSYNMKMDLLEIQLSEIRLATNDFHTTNLVGSGGYGTVYKATLDIIDVKSLSSMEGKSKDELPKIRKDVAIKKITQRLDDEGKKGFLAEIELLSSCNYQNIVSLLGFSNEDSEMILVYEYVLNGCLRDYLVSTRKINLTWVQRIQICLDIAHGLSYLHTKMEEKPMIIHRDIKSDNILLDENLRAKVSDFGLSKFHLTSSTVQTKNIAGTEYYIDPEFISAGKYKKESDVYSFGVVLFEVLCGRLAYDSTFTTENENGLAPIARRRFNEGTLKELIDPTITEEDDQIFTLNRGPNQDSFDSFSCIAYKCLAETQAKRPTMEVIIKELQSALKSQGETMVLSRFRLNDIVLATENFANTYCIDLDTNCMVYKAELDHFISNNLMVREGKNHDEPSKKRITVAIKRITNKDDGYRQQGFFEEIEMLCSCKHPNIVSLLGFCDDNHEMILVFEHASNGSLEDYLRCTNTITSFTWTERLHKCLEIAHGLNHLHTSVDNEELVIHGDIRSANILIGNNQEAKIAYFGISKLHRTNQEENMLNTDKSVATKVYWDPEYDEKTDKLKQESDIYSLGVILFEIFCGRLAYDPVYIENDKGLAPMAHQCFKAKTLRASEDIITSYKGSNKDSLKTFLMIARKCLEETQDQRPTIGDVIKELEIAINFQNNLKMSVEDIKSATENFSEKHYVKTGRYWKTYNGEFVLTQANSNANVSIRTPVVAKRFDSKSGEGERRDQFLMELEILFRYKHENIIGLVGYCDEMEEEIIIVKHESKGSLDQYLNDPSLTWIQRLKICIDVACGLEFLHRGDVMLPKVVHRNLKSQNIVLNDEWKAKISNLECSSLDLSHQKMKDGNDYANGTSDKSDIYSFGVILFEIFCGTLAWEESFEEHSESLVSLAKKSYTEGTFDELVFESIKEQIDQTSMTTFATIAYQCIEDRTTASEVVEQLRTALEFQEDKEIWGPKLPINYNHILAKAKTPEIYSTHNKKNLHEKLSQGIFF